MDEFSPAGSSFVNRIERISGHLKINRAIVTPDDQLANSFLGMGHLATVRYWLIFVHAAQSQEPLFAPLLTALLVQVLPDITANDVTTL